MDLIALIYIKVQIGEPSREFYSFVNSIHSGKSEVNDPGEQSYSLDACVFNEVKKEFKERCRGVRMAFYLGSSVTTGGNIYKNQHIQVCLWDASPILKPERFIPGTF